MNHYREELQAQRLTLKRTCAALDNLGAKVTVSALLGIDESVELYDKILRQRLKEEGAAIIPMPNVAHDDLLARDLGRRKPFTLTGKGYRDALIWETILALAGFGQMIFVTSNSDDFWGPSPRHPTLASDLVEDLAKDAVSPTASAS